MIVIAEAAGGVQFTTSGLVCRIERRSPSGIGEEHVDALLRAANAVIVVLEDAGTIQLKDIETTMTTENIIKSLLSRQVKADNIKSAMATSGGIKTTAELLGHTKLKASASGANFRWKSFAWGHLSVGACTCDSAGLVINTEGSLGFSCRLNSGDPGDDSWGILHLDFYQDNGVLLWSSGQFWSPTIPGGGEEWAFGSGFPTYLFDSIAYLSMSYHC
jgi:hypothetical protein